MNRRRGRSWAVVGRLGAGFLASLALWVLLARPYERMLAPGAQLLMWAFESPAVTRLAAGPGEIVVDRSDFPPSSPRPGLPAPDIHFNFVLLTTLFLANRRALSPRNLGRWLAAAAGLWIIHLAAVTCEVESVYATRLGAWSAAHYSALARDLWAAAFHFYLIAGRFAAPFALWWGFSHTEDRLVWPHTARVTKTVRRPERRA